LASFPTNIVFAETPGRASTERGLPTTVGNTTDGMSSLAKPALQKPLPMLRTTTLRFGLKGEDLSSLFRRFIVSKLGESERLI